MKEKKEMKKVMKWQGERQKLIITTAVICLLGYDWNINTLSYCFDEIIVV
jgi:hypothetical protein